MAKKKPGNHHKWIFSGILAIFLVGLSAWLLHYKNFAVLNSKGIVALKERNLIIVTVLLGLLVVVPVYIMTFAIAWRYREGNKKARYSPELSGNLFFEFMWWGIPSVIIIILSIIAWNSSHALDPHRALDVSAKKAITVEVVALDWKWLFIYPREHIASVNYVQFPVGTPVNFIITSDAPMNSFWIPQLAGQIYAMPGMSTQLHLVANTEGNYKGLSANLSGEGFSGMRFTAAATSTSAFNGWLQKSKHAPERLNMAAYEKLARPSQYNAPKLYAAVDPNLYDNVVLKYMGQIAGVNVR